MVATWVILHLPAAYGCALGLQGGFRMGFRLFLALLWVVLTGYTAVVIAHHGWALLPVFFGDIAAMTWPGQFNLDFLFMLMLSALWVAWRHRFSGAGLGLGLLAFFGGASFLTIYLFVLSLQSKGDWRVVLLGEQRL